MRPLAALAPRRGKGWRTKACSGGRPAKAWQRPGGRAVVARGRPFLLWAQPERRIPLWLSTLEQPQPSGRAGWVSAQTCSWQRCMHMGEGPPPLTPWPGAGEGRRDGGSGLGWVPCRTRPPRLQTAGGNSPPRHAERASVSPVPHIPPQEGSGAWDGTGSP